MIKSALLVKFAFYFVLCEAMFLSSMLLLIPAYKRSTHDPPAIGDKDAAGGGESETTDEFLFNKIKIIFVWVNRTNNEWLQTFISLR